MVIAANFLAVAFGGIFTQSLQPLTFDIIVTSPDTASINTEILIVAPSRSVSSITVATFTKDEWEPWLVVNPNVVEGTNLPPWVTDEFYFHPFEWESGNMSHLRTSTTQGYGGNLTFQLLAGNTF